MTIPLILIGIVVFALFAVGLYVVITRGGEEDSEDRRKTVYQYSAKRFFLTRAEHEYYDALVAVVGTSYYVFPQVHLPAIVGSKIVGQNWNAAFRHINGKSVDFVLCDKAYISPKLAIELDDKSHERPDRIERDSEVERILQQAGVPLLRLENSGAIDRSSLLAQINARLKTDSPK